MRANKQKETETQPQCDIDTIKMLNVRSVCCQIVSDLFHVWCEQKKNISVLSSGRVTCCDGNFQYF